MNVAERPAIPSLAWLEALPIGVGVFTAESALAFANPRFFQLLGLPANPAARPADLDGLLAMVQQTGCSGQHGAALLRARLADRCGTVQAEHWRRDDGQVVDIAAALSPDGSRTITLADVTPLAAAEQRATQQAHALEAILEAIPHGICVYSAERRVTMFNQAYSQVMAGAPLAVGDHLEAVIRRRAEAGEFGPGGSEQISAQQMMFDISRPQSRRRRRPNGTMLDVRTAPLPDGGHISVVTDITPLTEAEAEVSRRAEQMAAMLASIRHGILLWGPDRRLVASNAIAADLLNHPVGALTPGRAHDDLLDDLVGRGELGSGEAGRATIRDLRQRDHCQPYQRDAVTRSGRVVAIRSDPTPDGGWVTTCTDVTEARRAEEQLRRAKEAAEAANHAKSRFLANMSHELRTPLNAVIGFSDAMLREATNPSPARVAEFARQINESGRNLLALINIILDVARIESGRFDLVSDRVDVARVIRAAMRQSDAAAQAAEIALEAELPADLPAVRGDERRLQQVLLQLLSNAIKFTEAGGSVTVGATRERDGGLLIFVRDTGIGIAPEHLERVFEPFTQLDETLARRYHGAGLGLYLSRALIVGHGGSLTLESRPGQGTLAKIRLPAANVVSTDAG